MKNENKRNILLEELKCSLEKEASIEQIEKIGAKFIAYYCFLHKRINMSSKMIDYILSSEDPTETLVQLTELDKRIPINLRDELSAKARLNFKKIEKGL